MLVLDFGFWWDKSDPSLLWWSFRYLKTAVVFSPWSPILPGNTPVVSNIPHTSLVSSLCLLGSFSWLRVSVCLCAYQPDHRRDALRTLSWWLSGWRCSLRWQQLLWQRHHFSDSCWLKSLFLFKGRNHVFLASILLHFGWKLNTEIWYLNDYIFDLNFIPVEFSR